MSAADIQMQTYADTRIRPRAEAFRLLVAQCTDDKNNIGDEYARATSVSAWADNRTDPPHLLKAGNSANPDDFLNYNALATTFLALIAGTATPAQVAAFPGQWAVFQNACVRAPD